MDDKIKANLQFINSFVKDSYIKVHKQPKKNKNNVQLDIEVKMSNISETSEKNFNANLILIEKLKMFDEDSKELMIELEVQMWGKFIGKNVDKNQFIEMIKYSGTPQLSQLIRSYVITMTSVGGLTPIRIPMINFVEFFKKEKE